MKHKMYKNIRKVFVVLLWLALWQAAAVWAHNSILLVGPIQVIYAFVQNMLQPDFLKIIVYSFVRIGLGFFLALFLGLFLGAVGYRFPVAAEVAGPAIQALKSVPVASFVVLLLIWFGSERLSFFISLFIVFPNVYVNTMAGLKSTDVKLLEMSHVFGLGRWNRFFYIYRPALMPYLYSCLKISLGMSWKSGVAAEVIGLPAYSLGERLYMSKIYLDTAGLLAWTLTIILVSYGFEKAVLALVKKADTWKPYPVPASCINRTINIVGKVFLARRCGYGFRTWQNRGAGMGYKRSERGVKNGIVMSHISKTYGSQQVLQDYNMVLEAGQRYLLMAPSGAGKTTLLRILTGLEDADQGQVTGVPTPAGMVFQEDRLCEEYDAVCNIMLGMGQSIANEWPSKTDGVEAGENYGKRKVKKAQIAEFVRQEASLILPEECLTKPVRELSGGMRRRVALLRAVLSGSDFLILDEPFSGLDEKNRVRCGEYLLARLQGRALLAATHREEDAELLQGTMIWL